MNKAKMLLQGDRAFVEFINMRVYFLVSQLFKIISEQQSDCLRCITFPPMRAKNGDTVLKSAVPRIAASRTNAADEFAV